MLSRRGKKTGSDGGGTRGGAGTAMTPVHMTFVFNDTELTCVPFSLFSSTGTNKDSFLSSSNCGIEVVMIPVHVEGKLEGRWQKFVQAAVY